jgi:phosphocarrier protein FPr
MLKREQTKSTYLEGGIAIPHGNPEDSALIKRDALAVIQVPAGLDWGDGKKATLIVAIAAGSDGHLAILRRLVNVLKDKALMQLFSTTTDPSEIKKVLLQK